MNYYDYRSYFQDILSDLDRVLGNQNSAYTQDGELLTEVRDLREEFNTKIDKLTDTVSDGFQMLSLLIVAAIAVKVIFK